MDKEVLFNALKRQTKATLLELLYSAYDKSSTQQRHDIFGRLVEQLKPSRIVANDHIEKVEKFYENSLSRIYYAPFSINSKNYSHIPEETKQWFDKLGDLLKYSAQLTKQKEYSPAVESFEMFYELIGKMEDGEEIIFADEYGSWMIPGNEKEIMESYIVSLAKVKTPEEYTQALIPLLKRDSYSSFYNKVYSVAIKYSNKEQSKYLRDEIKKQKIRYRSA